MNRVILVAVRDLLFGSKIQEAGKRSGTPLAWASRFEKLRDVAAAKRPDVIVADLAEAGMLDELAAVKSAQPGVKVIGFAGHVNETALEGAAALGADEVYTKGQFAAQVERILVRERGG